MTSAAAGSSSLVASPRSPSSSAAEPPPKVSAPALAVITGPIAAQSASALPAGPNTGALSPASSGAAALQAVSLTPMGVAHLSPEQGAALLGLPPPVAPAAKSSAPSAGSSPAAAPLAPSSASAISPPAKAVSMQDLLSLVKGVANAVKDGGAKALKAAQNAKLLSWDFDSQQCAIGFHLYRSVSGEFFDKDGKSHPCAKVSSLNRTIEGRAHTKLKEFLPCRGLPLEAAAYKARLYCDSVIISVNGKRITSADSLFLAFYEYIDSQPPIQPNGRLEPLKLTMIERGTDALHGVPCRIDEAVTKDFDITFLAHFLKLKVYEEAEARNPYKGGLFGDVWKWNQELATTIAESDSYFNYLVKK